MLVTDDTLPNDKATKSQFYAIMAGGFSAACDAFAREPETDGLWICSMVGYTQPEVLEGRKWPIRLMN